MYFDESLSEPTSPTELDPVDPHIAASWPQGKCSLADVYEDNI